MLLEKPRIPMRDVLLFGLLPGILKIWVYRLRGYRIGKRVSIGFGSVICADQVEVGDDTKIGFLTIIRGKQVKIGARVQIGSTTFLDTPFMEIGDGTKINEQVFVGGLQFPDSKLVVGTELPDHADVLHQPFPEHHHRRRYGDRGAFPDFRPYLLAEPVRRVSGGFPADRNRP